MPTSCASPSTDTIAQLYYAGDMEAYRNKMVSLIPRIQKQTGIIVTKTVSPEKLKAYTTVGGVAHLDGGYTVFGKVIKGLDVIDKIAAQPRDASDRPTEDIRMVVTVEELSKSKIEKQYGYTFPKTKK